MHRRRPGPGLLSLVFPAVLIGFLAASQVSLAPDRPAPVTGEIDLGVEGAFWTSEQMRVDATAVALTWDGAAPAFASVRASEDGTYWGEWTEIHASDDHGPDPGAPEGSGPSGEFSEVVYVGDARWLQFRIGGSPNDLGVAYVDTTGRSRALGERLGDFLERLEFARTDAAAAAPALPDVNLRFEWGGDQCRAQNDGEELAYHDGVAMMFVHHTVHAADSNTYEADDVADLIYAICSFHVGVRGWSDIGYNALIDKFGRVWEGRAGGLDRSVQGAHTGGFNSYSTGVAFIGDYQEVVPTDAAEQALIEFAAWKLDIHHVDPRSQITLESLGSSRWEEGELVTLPRLAGHKDASLTACPGSGIYYRLEQWAEAIAATGGAKIFGDWQPIGDVSGSLAGGYDPTTFPFHFSEEMSWAFVISDQGGNEVFRHTDVGTEGAVTWDGTKDGEGLPQGTYTALLEAVPVSGTGAPNPAMFKITLGDVSFEGPFSDDEGSVHEDDIALIAASGITTGCAPERFCPRIELNRWQMALFLTRLHTFVGLGYPSGSDHVFHDIGQLPNEYQEAIQQLAALGVTLGTGPNTFDPEGIVSREQMALFLVRWLALAGVTVPDEVDQGFTDIAGLPQDQQTAINQLAQLGVTTGTAPGVFSPKGLVTREQMASFIARSMRIVPGLELPEIGPTQ